MKVLSITPLPAEVSSGTRRYSCVIERKGDTGSADPLILFYELPAEIPAIDPSDADPFFMAALMLAMKEKRQLTIHGAVSRSLFENLEEWMAAWKCWKPERYDIVSLVVDGWKEANSYPQQKHNSVAAYSGGVDASFLLWSWTRIKQNRMAPLCRAFFVHGFDIPLQDSSYEKAFVSNSDSVSSLGIPLDCVRTNFREVISTNWEDTCGIALASCMHFYKPLTTRGLIASSEPYNGLVVPWGTTPVLDHLLGSDDFRIMHEGATHGRSHKLAELIQWPEGMANLRVCWQGAGQGGNCGRCEKCLRTKLNFWAVDFPSPPSLGAPLTLSDVKNFKLANQVLHEEFRQILAYARSKKPDDEIARAFDIILKKFLQRQRAKAIRKRIRQKLKACFRFFRSSSSS